MQSTYKRGLVLILGLFSLQAFAEDIDLFMGSWAGGTPPAPNVIIFVDNSPNWSRAAQHWPDNGGTQGAAEMAAISQMLGSLGANTPINLGLALFTTGSIDGGYVRFAARDMTTAANKTALTNIVNYISQNINSPSEKLTGMAHKDESAGFYELWKYFHGYQAYAGGLNTGSQNFNADSPNALGVYSGAGQGLASGFALKSDDVTYNSPPNYGSGCVRNYIIYISNNANNVGSTGSTSYETGANTLTASTTGLTTQPNPTYLPAWSKTLFDQDGTVTYVLDAYKDQQNVAYSTSLQYAAKIAGGRYFQVSKQSDILAALSSILADIQAVNSTFASASLPVSAQNRAQDQNQVFIGMFRPDPNAYPRWMGNLKSYQLINYQGEIDLGDMLGFPAVSQTTGFITSCAVSQWTTDTTPGFWHNAYDSPSPSQSAACPNPLGGSYDPLSDYPDGPIVEKGGVAEVIRKGNGTTPSTLWSTTTRTIYTTAALPSASNALATLNRTSPPSGLTATMVDWVKGLDAMDENGDGVTATTTPTQIRASLHGDVIHSRPQPVTYNDGSVYVFYGANDGLFRAVNASNGQEKWAFLAPEFYAQDSGTRISRLMNNSPQVVFPGEPAGITPTPTKKNYFFDGSSGLYQNTDGTVWLYGAMRRGGRMIYAFDVSTISAPTIKWRFGCPNLTDNVNCTTGTVAAGQTGPSSIGQTWSTPQVAFVEGYSTTTPVVIVGGGYDGCEDADTATPTCTSPKGAIIYVLNGDTGAVIRSFTVAGMRSVPGDIALLSTKQNGLIDLAYFTDTGGNIYRINFTNPANGYSALTPSNWTIANVAYTHGASRKFLFAPAIFYYQQNNVVFVAVGSGDREHPLSVNYPYTTPVTNRFFVYMDDPTLPIATTATDLDSTTNGVDVTTDPGCASGYLLSNLALNHWFMNFSTGEQTVTSAVIVGGAVAFSTNKPTPAAPNTCAASLGQANGYWLNLLNGSGAIGTESKLCGQQRSSPYIGGGLPPSPVVGVGIPVNGKSVTVVIGAADKTGAPSSPIQPNQVKPPVSQKRKTIYRYSTGN